MNFTFGAFFGFRPVFHGVLNLQEFARGGRRFLERVFTTITSHHNWLTPHAAGTRSSIILSENPRRVEGLVVPRCRGDTSSWVDVRFLSSRGSVIGSKTWVWEFKVEWLREIFQNCFDWCFGVENLTSHRASDLDALPPVISALNFSMAPKFSKAAADPKAKSKAKRKAAAGYTTLPVPTPFGNDDYIQQMPLLWCGTFTMSSTDTLDTVIPRLTAIVNEHKDTKTSWTRWGQDNNRKSLRKNALRSAENAKLKNEKNERERAITLTIVTHLGQKFQSEVKRSNCMNELCPKPPRLLHVMLRGHYINYLKNIIVQGLMGCITALACSFLHLPCSGALWSWRLFLNKSFARRNARAWAINKMRDRR